MIEQACCTNLAECTQLVHDLAHNLLYISIFALVLLIIIFILVFKDVKNWKFKIDDGLE